MVQTANQVDIPFLRANSWALVFGAGTVTWAWGLDDQHDPVTAPYGDGTAAAPDVDMRQATVTRLHDMSADPTTLRTDWGLRPPSDFPDRTVATSTIAAPAANAKLAVGSAATLRQWPGSSSSPRAATVASPWTRCGRRATRMTGPTAWPVSVRPRTRPRLRIGTAIPTR